jgi:hypothetical protein
MTPMRPGDPVTARFKIRHVEALLGKAIRADCWQNRSLGLGSGKAGGQRLNRCGERRVGTNAPGGHGREHLGAPLL